MPSASAKAKSEDNYYRRAQLEALMREEFPALKVFEGDDGTEFYIGNPNVLDDDLIEELGPLEGQVEIARAHLDAHMGEGTYDGAFRAAGGSSWMIMLAIRDETERVQARMAGGGSPTR